MLKNSLSILLLSAATSAFAQPNFVFILVDDMGWTGTSVQLDKNLKDSKSDFYQTPNIEKLAAEGMRFSNAYSPAALCTPSRAAILTGKTPVELHMTTPGGGRPQNYQKLKAPKHLKNLPTQEITIAEALKKAGYATAHFGKWHLGSVGPEQHGFDVHDGATGNESHGTAENPKDIFGLTQRALTFMETQANANKPFYLQLSHYAVHNPFETRAASKQKFDALPKGTEHTDTTYAGMTWDLDTSIGTLLKKLDELKLTDSTYVILMSDNGAASTPRIQHNRPLNGGKGTFYEGGIRVPLIIRGPGIAHNSFCTETVTGCDLLPTLCQLAKTPAPDQLEGLSLVPLLAQKPPHDKRTAKALLFHFPHYGQGPRQKPQTALIAGDYKLIRDLETGALQLFNLKEDLGETKNLVSQNPEKAAELEALMDRRLNEVGAQQPTENPNYDPSAQPVLRGNRRRRPGA